MTDEPRAALADLPAALPAPIGLVRVIAGDLRIDQQPDDLSISLIERSRDRVRAL